MAKLAFFSDVHASKDVLEAVLEDIDERQTGFILSLGDVVGYGSEPAACVERIRQVASHTVLGNHDLMTISSSGLAGLPPEVRIPIELARRQLTRDQCDWLASRPLTDRFGDIEICHASLHQPGQFIHQEGIADLRRHFARQSAKFSFFGHTHIPVVYHEDASGRIRMARGVGKILLSSPGRYAIGVGSVAFSRDEDQRPCWVEFDDEEMSVGFRRTAWPPAAAV